MVVDRGGPNRVETVPRISRRRTTRHPEIGNFCVDRKTKILLHFVDGMGLESLLMGED